MQAHRRQHLGLLFTGKAGGHQRCLRIGGTQAVAVNILVRAGLGHALCQGDHAGLGCGIRGRAQIAATHLAGDGGHVHDASAADLSHVAEAHLTGQKYRRQIHGEDLVPLLQRQILKIVGVHNARVVDQDIHMLLVRNDLLEHAHHLSGVRQIHRVERGVAQLAARLLTGDGVDVHDDSSAAHRHELLGNGLADALRATGNNAGLTMKGNILQQHLSLSSSTRNGQIRL